MTDGASNAPRNAQLELRHRALGLQRRRFWRELTYGVVTLASDVLTLSLVFAVLGALPISASFGGFGEGGESFVRGLIPQTPQALARRVTLLVFSLFVTRCYAHTERREHPARIGAALLLGLLLPRWVEVWQSDLPARWMLISLVLVVSWLALVLQRRGLVRALRPIDPRRHAAERTLVVGSAPEVERAIGANPIGDERPRPRAFVLDPAWPATATEGMRSLAAALADADADAVVLVGPVSDTALQAVMIAAASAGATVYASRRSAFYDMDEPSFVLRRTERLSLLSRPALVGSQLVLKRIVDYVGAAAGLVVLAPVFALVALAVRVTSRGPVFFRQTRVGLGGDFFEMVKFRTMVVNAEQQQAALHAANVYTEDPLFKLASDPRLTPIGRFLRRSSLDELPQLINVVRGEMSLVGPRPALPSEVSRYQQHHFVRFEVLPGMTGPWQVGGRNAIRNFEQVVQLEADYIRGWTVWRDFWILIRTVPAVLTMRGAF
ncbi:MAG: sugar transferase [Gemmatimonadota bacterium]|nr:sugar transferase [Gemmatimonadota bacterium]